jgi:hypothetical protein
MSKIIFITLSLVLLNSLIARPGDGFLFQAAKIYYPHHRSLNISPDDIEILTEGFINGLSIFNNISKGNCTEQDFQQVKDDVVELIQLVKNITWDSRVVQEIEQIYAEVRIIYSDLQKVAQPCQAYAEQVDVVINNVQSYVENADYLGHLPVHIIENFDLIEQKSENATQLFKAGDYNGAGLAYGNLVNFAFLWNFQA